MTLASSHWRFDAGVQSDADVSPLVSNPTTATRLHWRDVTEQRPGGIAWETLPSYLGTPDKSSLQFYYITPIVPLISVSPLT